MLSLCSTTALAGDWFDDWEYKSTPSKVTNVYKGEASCAITYPGQNGYSITKTFTLDVEDVYTSSVYFILDNYGIRYSSYKYDIPALNAYSCVATVPYDRSVPLEYYFWHEPIAPYPGTVDIERLGCINSYQRKVTLSLEHYGNATSMKVYAQSAPHYPEVLVHSGSAAHNPLITVGATSNTLYIRTKLDNGSSHYSSISGMSCSGGGGRPLD